MAPASNEEQFKFLISCIRWSNSGKVSFVTISVRYRTDISRLISEKSPRNVALSPRAQRKSTNFLFRLVFRFSFLSDIQILLFVWRPVPSLYLMSILSSSFYITSPIPSDVYISLPVRYSGLPSVANFASVAYPPSVVNPPSVAHSPSVGCLGLILTFFLPS